ncbi:MAG: histidine phosphatase family protein [Candidatus Krumholzibacteria bacterium]|nr:histidine phosphatase family protein [Candidatus Krumholzibacteria bacterium]
MCRFFLIRSVLLIVLMVAAVVPATANIPTHDEPTRTIYLVRHGYYDWDNEDDPDTGKALVALGRQQARLIAARLDALPIEFTSLQGSAMTRARQTAEIIAPHFPELELQILRDIRECTMTTRRQDIMDRLDPGEAAECEAQLEAAWQRLFVPATGATDEHDIVVCHGNVVRWFVTRALDVDPTAWLGMSVSNGSLTTIQVRADGSFKVLGVGDSGHIPYRMNTFGADGAEQ